MNIHNLANFEEEIKSSLVSGSYYEDGLNISSPSQAISFSKILKSFKDDIESIKEEQKRLAMLKKSADSKSQLIKDAIIEYFEKEGIKKIDDPLNPVKVTEGGSKLIIDESFRDEIPAEYWKEKTERSLDKEKIKADLEEGVCIDGAALDPVKRVQLK